MSANIYLNTLLMSCGLSLNTLRSKIQQEITTFLTKMWTAWVDVIKLNGINQTNVLQRVVVMLRLWCHICFLQSI